MAYINAGESCGGIERKQADLGKHRFWPPKPTLYDTAWICMLSKPSASGALEWAFPESFQFLLDHQQANGGWATGESKTDQVLTNSAAILALKSHLKSPVPAEAGFAPMLESRLSAAVAFLQNEIDELVPEACAHVGYEILISAHLSMLELEKIKFNTSARSGLIALKKSSLTSLELDILYGPERSALLYLLEAFIGLADFEKLRHHKVQGGMMHSPSATAAYLMGLQGWDVESELYLRNAIQATGTVGGVPSVFPCVSSESGSLEEAVLEIGFPGVLMETSEVRSMNPNGQLQIAHKEELTGFDIYLSTEELLTKFVLLKAQSSEDNEVHLVQIQEELTRQIEAHGASLTTRCRFLESLLRSPRVGGYGSCISSMANSVCNSWWIGDIKTSQNLSPYYTMMLLVECFAKMQRLSKTGSLVYPTPPFVECSGPITIIQILGKILAAQNADGGWGGAEATAYALLALRASMDLPYVHILSDEIRFAVAQGLKALSLMLDAGPEPQNLWVGKVASSSQELLNVYVSAALRISYAEPLYTDDDERGMKEQTENIMAFSEFFSGLKHLREEKMFMIKGAILEGSYYTPLLKAMRTQIFPQTLIKEADKYLDYIPIISILSSTGRKLYASPEYLFDLMVVSMFAFLVDEYMESTVAHFSEDEIIFFKKALREIHPITTASLTNPSLPGFQLGLDELRIAKEASDAHYPSPRLQAAILVFRSWASAVMKYPRVNRASQSDLVELRSEMQNYLLYHVSQIEDNARLMKQKHDPEQIPRFQTPRTSYPAWVHSIGAGHVSCSFIFAFVKCVIGGSLRAGADCFATVKQKLMAYNMNRHVGSFTRMYNDCGSVVRDRDEGNLNSINFPEFFPLLHHRGGSESNNPNTTVTDEPKATLLAAAQYERKCANEFATDLFQELEAEGAIGRAITLNVKIYVEAFEQWADLYLNRDVTNRVK